MAEAKVPYDRLEDSGDGAVYGSRIRVSSTNTDSISEAIDKLETGISDTVFRTRRDFTGVPSSGDEQYILFGRGALPGTGFRWNENTDKVEFSNDGLVWVDITSIGGSSTKVEPVEITAPILANKYFDLDLLPSSGSNVRVFLVGGSVQYPTDDYELILDGGSLLKRVSWNGKGLESVLTLGDKVLFVYETTEEISGISSGPIKLKVDALSITATEIGNEWVDLSEIPLDYDQVALFVAGGTIQVYTTDYTIGIDGLGDLRRIDLSTLIANNDIEDGDTLIALYNIGSSAGGAIRSEHIEVETSTFTNNLNGLVAPATLQEALEEIDQFAFAGGIVTQTITNGVTATAPSEDAVFDALSGKANTSHTHAASVITTTAFTGNLTGEADVQGALDAVDSLNIAQGLTSTLTSFSVFDDLVLATPFKENSASQAYIVNSVLSYYVYNDNTVTPTLAPYDTNSLGVLNLITGSGVAGSGSFLAIGGSSSEFGPIANFNVNNPPSGLIIDFEARVARNNIAATHDFFFGLIEAGNPSGNPFTNNNILHYGFGFQLAGNWFFRGNDDSNLPPDFNIDTGLAADLNWHTYRLVFDTVLEEVSAYVDGVQVGAAQSFAGSTFTDNVGIGAKIYTQDGNNWQMVFDYFKVTVSNTLVR